jgi:hypothetical protein
MDVTELSWAKLWCSVCYTVVSERSMAMFGCPLKDIDVAKGSRAMEEYIDVSKRSRALLRCPVGYIC